jgi:hypothetical protein
MALAEPLFGNPALLLCVGLGRLATTRLAKVFPQALHLQFTEFLKSAGAQ